jgi:hypothetical protein
MVRPQKIPSESFLIHRSSSTYPRRYIMYEIDIEQNYIIHRAAILVSTQGLVLARGLTSRK